MAQVARVQQHRSSGVIAASLTPMNDDGSAHLELMSRHCRALIAEGCSSLVIMGTTGEANSFTVVERKEILSELIHQGVSPHHIIVGTGMCALPDALDLNRHALSSGVARVLMLPPFYYKKVSEDGLFDAFASIIEGVADSRLRVYLYLIPQLSGVDVNIELIERLLQAYPKTIAGLKDSSGLWPATEALCRRLGGRMDVLVGTESLLLHALDAGASGCVSATANVNASAIAELWEKRTEAEAAALQRRVTAKRVAFEKFPMISALKATLAIKSGIRSWRNLRPPLRQISEAEAAQLVTILERDTGVA
jgi:4-hydroxy-tetrahydrodipicolinate synthase